jgi:hypothetical protein
VHALRFGVDAAGNGTGVSLTIDLLDQRRAAELGKRGWVSPEPDDPKDKPYFWNTEERVEVGARSLLSENGTGRSSALGLSAFRDAVSAACRSAPSQPIEIRILLAGGWPK